MEIFGGKYWLKKEDLVDEEEDVKVVVCVCCYILWNYGKVKDESLENFFFDFDFECVVGVWLKKVYGR